LGGISFSGKPSSFFSYGLQLSDQAYPKHGDWSFFIQSQLMVDAYHIYKMPQGYI
jgi:hypothetical protein